MLGEFFAWLSWRFRLRLGQIVGDLFPMNFGSVGWVGREEFAVWCLLDVFVGERKCPMEKRKVKRVVSCLLVLGWVEVCKTFVLLCLLVLLQKSLVCFGFERGSIGFLG